MKRYLLAITTLLLFAISTDAAHIKGGFFSYQYLGPGTNNPSFLKYKVTLTVYMICSATAGQISDPINFTIFNGGTNAFIQNVSVGIKSDFLLNKTFDEPCITGNQAKCYYRVIVYELASIELAPLANGYIFAYQRCCRIAGIQNVVNSGTVGNTFDIKIPGTSQNAQTNSSPLFPVNDTVVVCSNSSFQYSFQATDADPGDSLSYEFCNAVEGADQTNSAPPTAANPPYFSVPYQLPFNGTKPMGPNVSINPVTGLISGVAPGISGEFVVSVCVKEYKSGVLIGTTRKELHVEVGNCQPITPQLQPLYLTCDGMSFVFSNTAPFNPLVTSYFWDFGVTTAISDTSTLASPPFDYPDTGIYIIKLIVNKGQPCTDSVTSIVKVYPGFFPGFEFSGSCFTNPFQFTDTTNTRYGVVDSWKWNFGDASTLADTSRIQNPQWTYNAPGQKNVQLIVTNSKGCVDTAQVVVDVLDKPVIALAFRDTLICIPDNVELNASGTGVFNWTPMVNIANPNTPNPTVSPTTDTWYVANLNDNGCVNKDSVHVRVVTGVNISARADTTICLTDAVQLDANTNGLIFQWSPALTLDNPSIRNPTARPTAQSTTYTLLASIGSCSNSDDVIINTVPYPIADAGAPQIICYNSSAKLNATHDGDSIAWTPSLYLDDPTIVNPVSTPPRTTSYIFTVWARDGCPKPVSDTVLVTVRPKVLASAGSDTTVIVGQPLQFNGSGGVTYSWSPSSFLSDPNIPNPVGIYPSDIDSISYQLLVRDSIGCADSATVKVYVWKTNPYIFVPTAFTPNNDGKNDVIRPIAVGVQKINYFSVYNRWGQLLFTTSANKHGWDGRVGGRLQNTGVFVWMVSAIDYLGRPIFLKGTVTLIR